MINNDTTRKELQIQNNQQSRDEHNNYYKTITNDISGYNQNPLELLSLFQKSYSNHLDATARQTSNNIQLVFLIKNTKSKLFIGEYFFVNSTLTNSPKHSYTIQATQVFKTYQTVTQLTLKSPYETVLLTVTDISTRCSIMITGTDITTSYDKNNCIFQKYLTDSALVDFKPKDDFNCIRTVRYSSSDNGNFLDKYRCFLSLKIPIR